MCFASLRLAGTCIYPDDDSGQESKYIDLHLDLHLHLLLGFPKFFVYYDRPRPLFTTFFLSREKERLHL